MAPPEELRERMPAPTPMTSRFVRDDDERLAQRIATGDERALETLYRRYHQGVYRYALTLVRSEQDALDATQEAFLRAIAALRDDRRNAPLRPWLFRIAHNESVNILRRRRRDVPAAEPEEQAAPQAPGERPDLGQLVADLDRLTERQRAALVMRELNGLSHADIAAALSISANAAKQAIFEARDALHTFAAGRERDCPGVAALIEGRDWRRLRARAVRAHLDDCGRCRALRDERAAARRAALAMLWPLGLVDLAWRAIVGQTAAGGLLKALAAVGIAAGTAGVVTGGGVLERSARTTLEAVPAERAPAAGTERVTPGAPPTVVTSTPAAAPAARAAEPQRRARRPSPPARQHQSQPAPPVTQDPPVLVWPEAPAPWAMLPPGPGAVPPADPLGPPADPLSPPAPFQALVPAVPDASAIQQTSPLIP